MGGKIEKAHGGTQPGPRGGVEAGERREAPNGGQSGAPRARRCAPVWFLNFTTHHENKVKISAKKSEISAKSTLLSQKQRRYAYDGDVYAKNVFNG